MTILFRLIVFIFLTYGLFLLLNINVRIMAEDLAKLIQYEKSDIRSIILKRKKKKGSRLLHLMRDTENILLAMGKGDKVQYVWLASLLLFIAAMIFAMMIDNIFLVPVLAGGIGFLPFWYVLYLSQNYKKQINAEIETALSIVTTSYVRCENIVTAVEENMDYINPPLRNIFKEFLVEKRRITASTETAIRNMRDKVSNNVFKEWCEILIACQSNRNLKVTLMPTLEKLSDERVVQAEVETIIQAPMKEFILMGILSGGSIFFMKILNEEWFAILTQTTPGKIILAVFIGYMFYSLSRVMFLIRPIEYSKEGEKS